MKKTLLLVTLLLVIFLFLDLLFTSVYQKGDYSKEQWLMNLKGGTYDYGVLGSSRAYTTVDVKSINERTGLNGINLGIDGSLISTQALVFEVLLDADNKFDKIFFQIDSYNSNDEAIGKFTRPRFMPFIRQPIVFDHFKKYGLEWYAYKYIPYLRYAEYNFDWGPHNFLNHLLEISNPDHDEAGSFFYPNPDFVGAKNTSEYLFDLDGEYAYLNRVVDLCKKNGIEIILFTAPLASVAETEAHIENADAFKLICEDLKVPYYDFRTIYNEDYSMFTNYNHLNRKGVSDFSARLEKLIVKEQNMLTANN
ncbi:hypothetical protein [Reichenbachiella ulvae]|uniref:SGNH/GDSL hydrolase family protein n=1 Tax=Reichenbachiella ulvae TaxID=2980104 RepID=A0ABT3CN73_9BACT|nr:hypothetical protein [Reichenbachiella ulvae]MCV9385037.1 hypothetical protein [Reichenbachiella ulvae]